MTMVERHGVQGTIQDGVFFTEREIPGVTAIEPIRVEISRQNANLHEVKMRMAGRAQKVGAAAIMNFRYGQRKHAWWQLVFTFRWDTESWFGEGDAVRP